MSANNLDFEVTDAGMDEGGFGKLRMTIIPKGDYRFFGYIYKFHNIEMKIEDDGVGVSYELNVDFAGNTPPPPVTAERQKEIQDFGQKLLNKFVEDTMTAIFLGLDRSQHELYTMKGCTEACEGECYETV